MCYFSHMSTPTELEPVSALFKALGSPLRLAVVTALDEAGPLCVHELVSRLGVPQPLVSQHLRVLREADVVRGVRRGKEIAYEIADAHVAHVVRDAVRHTSEARSGVTQEQPA
jgi:ArsR family transcriptional regulator, zinc-responsive transcriptional repressor